MLLFSGISIQERGLTAVKEPVDVRNSKRAHVVSPFESRQNSILKLLKYTGLLKNEDAVSVSRG